MRERHKERARDRLTRLGKAAAQVVALLALAGAMLGGWLADRESEAETRERTQ